MIKIRQKENLIIVIPAYEPPASFIDYAKEASCLCEHLVVVNDGSNEEYDYIFDEISKIENATYISYDKNHGKGYALKKALEYCIESYSDENIIITADCDGQHKTKNIQSVYGAISEHPNTLMLGSRNFNLPNVPKRSKMGNTNIRRLFSMLYGIKLYDTQTGLRAFSVAMAREFLNIKGDRFEYEMSMLVYAKKHRIEILETPIDTVYPENQKEHISHFKTVKDSARVIGASLRNLNFYLISSVISAVVDVLVFFVLSMVIFTEISAVYTLIATATARVLSSLVNFVFNYKYVFNGKGKGAMLRYYILWLLQLGASYGIVLMFGNAIGLNLTATKIVGDLCLALISYQVQQHWVFKQSDSRNFYGPFVSFFRGLWKKLSKSYRCNVIPYDEGTVYVCRHLNMHGPLTTLKWLSFHVHPMVLSPFFNKKDCYLQYSEYTFSVREGKKKKKVNPKAYFCSRTVPLFVNSIKAIPVYRNSISSIKTLKKSLEYLKMGQSIIVYPDIDYTNDGSLVSDIYEGFLYLGELYKKKTGKSLKFIPLYINEEERTINECPPIVIDSFAKSKAEAKEYIINAINQKSSQ